MLTLFGQAPMGPSRLVWFLKPGATGGSVSSAQLSSAQISPARVGSSEPRWGNPDGKSPAWQAGTSRTVCQGCLTETMGGGGGVLWKKMVHAKSNLNAIFRNF